MTGCKTERKPNIANGHNADDAAFFQLHNDFCELLDGLLLMRYPKSSLDRPVMPHIMRQEINLRELFYLGFQNARRNDHRDPSNKTVGFFLRDQKFVRVCCRPWQYVAWLSQYQQVMSPDLSIFTDMPFDEQMMNTCRNRLVGAYWQFCGLMVIPTISWSDERSFEFAFDGVEHGSVVAISTIGAKMAKRAFMMGFREMRERIQPREVICYGNPFWEMHCYARITTVEHEGAKARRLSRCRPVPGQMSLFADAM
ncbi:MAG: DUF4417 domain-containing protein [Deltaproteobacteria bacterium]|nr:DUF4417 domain-containing protein [Deltaproteobacteria bacterium]